MPSVIIKPEAYYKMLVHVLRFGNKAREPKQFKEVMGILIGRLEGEPDKKGIQDVIVEDAVPISHGGSIEVAFSPEDYITFSTVDAAFAEKNWFSCGWYHSHPGLKIFFSSTDIRNQLGWQTPNNPSGVGIVFDHTYLEKSGDLGFRAIRLDNPAKGQDSGYEIIEAKVEPPDSIQYYIKLIKLINCVHSKEPPILEINEMPDLFGDITFPTESQIMVKKTELNSLMILSSLKAGLTKFVESFIDPLITVFNSWSEDIIKKIVENNLQMREDVIIIKNSLSKGISTLQKDFKFSIKEKLNGLDIYIDDKFEEFDSYQESFKESLENIKSELDNEFSLLIEKRLEESFNAILNQFNRQMEDLTDINNKKVKASESLSQQNSLLESVYNNIISIEELVTDKLDKYIKDISENFVRNSNKIVGNFINSNKDTKSFLSNLKAAIILLESLKTPLQNKLESQEIEIKTLKKNIIELEKKNKDLMTNIEKLNKKEE
ncbi:MAG: hypothetical protein ACFFC3_01445 [Candidatus Odinarchaeota archaeon]